MCECELFKKNLLLTSQKDQICKKKPETKIYTSITPIIYDKRKVTHSISGCTFYSIQFWEACALAL